MISDFQLALGGAAVALVVGVLIYNRWQESKYKRRAERAFQTDHPDVLIDGARPATDAARSAERVEPKLGSLAGVAPAAAPAAAKPAPMAAAAPAAPAAAAAPTARAAPAQSFATDELDDLEDLPPLEEMGRPKPDEAKSHGAPQLSAEIDSLALILADAPLTPAQYQPVVAHSRTMGKGVRWEGLVGGLWQGISPATTDGFRELRAGMQLADRGGAADARLLGQFDELIVQFARSVGAVAQREDVGAAVLRAKAVDEFCADTDVEIAVNVVGRNGTTFAVTKVRGLAEAKGMMPVDSGEYVMRDELGRHLFTLRNFDPAEPPGIKRANGYIAGLTFALDVPRTLNPARVFPQMFALCEQFAEILQGDVVDDNRRPLTANGRKVIADTVSHIATQMETKGVEPGSSAALRLYA
jgi:FtsZ-interacting cell division protein ZipA